MSNNIAGKVVVITGASSGLGDATARFLSPQGAAVALGARRVDRIQSLADELTGRGGKALAIETNVTHFDQVNRLVDAAVQTLGRIDVMINNARLMPQSPLESLKGRLERDDRHEYQGVLLQLPGHTSSRRNPGTLSMSPLWPLRRSIAAARYIGDEDRRPSPSRRIAPGSEALQHSHYRDLGLARWRRSCRTALPSQMSRRASGPSIRKSQSLPTHSRGQSHSP